MFIHYAVIAVYLTLLALLMVYCIHRYYILFLYLRHKNKLPCGESLPENLPRVTVQLPLYNEMYVVQRLLNAVAKLEYPKECLEVQVLDDSTDETSRLALEYCARLKEQGYTITYLHRRERHGFKAGALQAGLEVAGGELVAILLMQILFLVKIFF